MYGLCRRQKVKEEGRPDHSLMPSRALGDPSTQQLQASIPSFSPRFSGFCLHSVTHSHASNCDVSFSEGRPPGLPFLTPNGEPSNEHLHVSTSSSLCQCDGRNYFSPPLSTKKRSMVASGSLCNAAQEHAVYDVNRPGILYPTVLSTRFN